MRTPNEGVFFRSAVITSSQRVPYWILRSYRQGVFTFVCDWNSEVSNFFFCHQVNCQEGILHITNGIIDKEYCLVYNQFWTPLSQRLDTAVSVQFSFWTLFCNYVAVLSMIHVLKLESSPCCVVLSLSCFCSCFCTRCCILWWIWPPPCCVMPLGSNQMWSTEKHWWWWAGSAISARKLWLPKASEQKFCFWLAPLNW